MKQVLVADDHSLFRDGITSLLEAAGYEVIEQVGDGEQAIEAVQSFKTRISSFRYIYAEKERVRSVEEDQAGIPGNSSCYVDRIQ